MKRRTFRTLMAPDAAILTWLFFGSAKRQPKAQPTAPTTSQETNAAEVVHLARAAASLIAHGDLHSAAWRLADAGLLLRQIIDAQDAPNLHSLTGYARRTGRGAILPMEGPHQ